MFDIGYLVGAAIWLGAFVFIIIRYAKGTATRNMFTFWIFSAITYVSILILIEKQWFIGVFNIVIIVPLVLLVFYYFSRFAQKTGTEPPLPTRRQIEDPEFVRGYRVERILRRIDMWYVTPSRRVVMLDKALKIDPDNPKVRILREKATHDLEALRASKN